MKKYRNTWNSNNSDSVNEIEDLKNRLKFANNKIKDMTDFIESYLKSQPTDANGNYDKINNFQAYEAKQLLDFYKYGETDK